LRNTCEYVNPDYIARDEFGDWNAPNAVRKAAVRAEEVRERCVREGRSLAFETVLSMPDKIDFIYALIKWPLGVAVFSERDGSNPMLTNEFVGFLEAQAYAKHY
jgi:hypothetical protein